MRSPMRLCCVRCWQRHIPDSCPLSSPRLLVTQPTRDRLQDGRTVTAAVLVGADGNLSDVRRQLLDDGLPRFAGLAVWRAMRWGALLAAFAVTSV